MTSTKERMVTTTLGTGRNEKTVEVPADLLQVRIPDGADEGSSARSYRDRYRCRAITNDGLRCTRSLGFEGRGGLCAQHYKAEQRRIRRWMTEQAQERQKSIEEAHEGGEHEDHYLNRETCWKCRARWKRGVYGLAEDQAVTEFERTAQGIEGAIRQGFAAKDRLAFGRASGFEGYLDGMEWASNYLQDVAVAGLAMKVLTFIGKGMPWNEAIDAVVTYERSALMKDQYRARSTMESHNMVQSVRRAAAASFIEQALGSWPW